MDRLPQYPVFERVIQKDNTMIIILIIMIIVFVIAIAIVIYSIRREAETRVVGRCEPGLCAVNLETGIKRCPVGNFEQVEYNRALETCSSKNYCQDAQRAPCAVLAGGILNCDGVCGPGNDECPCVQAPR